MKSRIVVSLGLLAAFVLGALSYQPMARAVESFSIAHCTRLDACTGGINASTGAGVVGGSKGGDGARGWTTAVATSTSSPNAGVYGADLSASGTYDAGVAGHSTLGTGVRGTSASANGVVGQTSASGTGSDVASGVLGQDLSTGGLEQNSGVKGSTVNGYGVIGSASGVYGTGVYGEETNGGAGSGVSARADSAYGGSALGVFAPNGAAMISGGGKDYSLFIVDGSANITTTGEIYTTGRCSTGCVRTRRVRSYGMSAAMPTLEDNGEAQLAGGAAAVRLDPAFANAIDPHAGYIVQLTPEGDTRGLYVASRSATSFVVRETMGGRGSLPFAYRIVAHPYGVSAERLPFVEPKAGEPSIRARMEAARRRGSR